MEESKEKIDSIRKSAEEKKSLGLKITAERLALLNREDHHSSYEIEDLVNENGEALGTKVIIKIMNREPVEDLV